MTKAQAQISEIDKLEQWVSDIRDELNRLQWNVTLSESEKRSEADRIGARIDEQKVEIQKRIDELSSKTDNESIAEKEKAQSLLQDLTSLADLKLSIINSPSTTTTLTKEWEKWFFWKAWDWIWTQWWDVWDKEKWQTEWWVNLLRTAWFVATWVWAVALIAKWVKKLFWKDKKKEDSKDKKEIDKEEWDKKESSWRKKFLIRAWVGTWVVVWWVEIYKHWNRISAWVKEKLWLALNFNEAIQKVENEVRNWKIDDNHFWAFHSHFEWWINFDENTQEICSYGQRTKIVKEWKKLDWMDVEFASREELIHAANIVNFAKRKLKWRGASSTPFSQTNWWWDIAFNCSSSWSDEFLSASNSNERTWILGTLWTVWWWILWWYCAWVKWAAIWWVSWWLWWYALWAYIDNTSAAWRCCETIARWKNFDLFLNYLNAQKDENWNSLWESAWEQHVDPEWTPISSLIDDWWQWDDWHGILADIELAYGNDWEDHTWRRNFEVIWDESKPENYIIKSYWHEARLTIEWLTPKKWEKIDYSKITKIHIEKYNESDWWDWLDIKFKNNKKWLEEAIRITNLTNMIREDWSKKWAEKYPFAYWKYRVPFALEIDVPWMWTNYLWWTTILYNSTIREKYPTLHDDLQKFPSTESVFWNQEDLHDQAIRDKSSWSQYIKFLHQMREGKNSYWK